MGYASTISFSCTEELREQLQSSSAIRVQRTGDHTNEYQEELPDQDQGTSAPATLHTFASNVLF